MSYTASYIVNSSSAQGTTDFQFTFPYIQEDHIEVYVNYNKITRGSGSNQYQVITNVSPKLIRLNTGIASANLRVEVLRNSSLGTPIVDYADGSTLTANDLDTSALQSLYIDQELKDSQNRTVTVDEATGLPTLNDQRLTDVADPVAAQDAATKNYVDTNDNLQLSRSGGHMTGDIATQGNRISGLPWPSGGSEPVTKNYFEAQSWDNTTETIASNETWAGSNTTIATTGAIDSRIDSKIDTAIEGDVLAGTDLTKTQTGGQVTINHSVTGASSVNNQNGVVLQDLTINPRGHITGHSSTDLDTRYYLKTQLEAGQLDNRYYTETELLTDGVLDARYYTETEADARFYNLDSGEEIRSGETWSAADNKIATTAAIDARIVDLVEEVGGFVPIANETSFPTANPDINNGTGTLVSVQVLASSHTPSGGNVNISNGAGSGNTVTITGCGSTVLAAGYGLLLETTSTLHTYTFHRLTPKATEVSSVAGNNTNINTVATNINDVITVANDLNESTSEINTVANDITNVNTVGNAIANVNTAATNIANINTVASDLNETTSEIDTVATNIANVNTVGTSIANVNTVANDLNETTSEIDTVATNIANVNTVGNAITNVNNVGGSIVNVNTVATNLADVSNYADRYQIASSDPSTRADSSSLQEGDQYFNTTSDVLKVYDGTNWNTGVTDTTGFAVSTGQTFTGNVGVPAATNGAPGLFIAGDTDTGIYSPGANLLAITASGTKILEAGSSGITVTGSISGNLNASQLNTGTVPTARLGSGTASSSNFLRGDNSWQTVDTSTVTVANSSAAATTYPLFAGSGSTSSGTLNALSNTSFTFNASTGELGTKRLTLTHGSSGSDTPLEINGSSAGGQKIKLSGSGAPYIQFQENTTDKAYIRWDNTPGSGSEYFLIHNQQSNRILAIDTEFKVSYNNGSNWNTVWNAGNDGSGSGLDADTLDGVQGSSYLRSDTNDTFTGNLTLSGELLLNSTKLTQSGSTTQNLKLRGYNTGGSTDVGISGYNNADTWCFQLYGQPGYYGFLDGNWNSWDIRKAPSGAFEVDEGSGLKRVINTGNVGSGGALSSSAVYVNDLYASNWFRNTANGEGLYNEVNGNHFYSDSANYWTVAYNGGSGGLRIRDGHAGTVRGYLYANDSNEVGLLTNAGNWAIKVDSNAAAYFYGGGYPYSNGNSSLGHSGLKWNQVHANTFHGDGSNLTNLPSTGDTPTVKTSNYTASTGDIVVVNASNLTITLPSSPSAGDKVSVRILGGNFCNVARNGQKIEEQNEDLAIDTYDGCAKLVYVDSTRGWLITC